jgi:hypothetical protein
MKYFFVFFFLFIAAENGLAQASVDSLITELKREIERKDTYVTVKQRRIDNLNKKLPTLSRLPKSQQFEIYNGLYHLYKTFIYDSAFKYSQRLIQTAYEMKDPVRIAYARLKLGFILVSSGMFKETFDSLGVVDESLLPDSSKVDYYNLLARAYNDLSGYNNDQYYRMKYDSYDLLYLDSALRWSKPESYEYYHLTAAKILNTGDHKKAIEIIQHILKNFKLTNPQLAVKYFDLSSCYRSLGNNENNLKYTMLSAMADIRAATKETLAMYTLAQLLYEAGDNEHAYLFIKEALDDAEFYGARQRKVAISSLHPLIASAALNQSESKRAQLVKYGIALSMLLGIVILFSVVVFKQLQKLKAAELRIKESNNKLTEANTKLQEANRIKEEYIGYYFSVNSEFLDKIESFKQSVDQKLTNRKYDDIRFIINNINSKRERDELYHSFDKIFLKLFPDFVKTFNSYLKPEEQFALKDGQLLNTELRIFALIRLGITETDDIARILNYSVNTIYAYKTKTRNKSVLPNDVFDRKIMEIKAIEPV